MQGLLWQIRIVCCVLSVMTAGNDPCAMAQAPAEHEVCEQWFVPESPLTTVAFSADGQFLFGGAHSSLRYWHFPSRELRGHLPTKLEAIYDISVSSDGQRVAVAGGTPGEVGIVEVWDSSSNQLVHTAELHDDVIMQVDWSAEERHLVTAGFDGTVVVWDWNANQAVSTFAGHSKPVLSVRCWGIDQVLSAGVDHSVRLWNASTGLVQRHFDNHLGSVVKILLEPNGAEQRVRRMISIGEDKTVRLWQPEIGRLIRFQRLPSVPVTGAWDGNSNTIVVGCENGTLYRLESDSLKILAAIETGVGRIQSVAIEPTARQVVVSGQKAVAITTSSEAAKKVGLSSSLKGRRPNIIFFLTDDQGYGDLSAHGNPILKTPNLDHLHSRSVRFTNFQVSPTCSPTRSALMTGRHEFRNGVTHTIHERERLNLEATTLAQTLQSAGYKTGIFGKWHLGDEDAYLPSQRGFDEVFIHGAGGIGQIFPGSCGDVPGNSYFDPWIWHNHQFLKTQGYCTDVFYGEAIQWLEQQHHSGQPFFAFLPSNTPHDPFLAKPEDFALYKDTTPDPDVANFYGMLHNIDLNVGAVVKKLQELGIEQDTLLIFMNDNGTSAGQRVYNVGMRGAKGSPWIGGTRAISFWSWSGRLAPADCAELSAHLDVFPTLVEIAGATMNARIQAQVEGRSLLPLLENPETRMPDRYLITHVGRWPKFSDPNQFKYRGVAVRNRRWSLVSERGAAEPQWQLFDLEADPGQQNDLTSEHPLIVSELSAVFEKWWSEIQPSLCNEDTVGPELNPFAERYWRQFGGGPNEADRKRMKPPQPKIQPATTPL